MPRPHKNRYISGIPGSIIYKPAGIPTRQLEKVVLGLDEFETIHLLDYQGHDQAKTAELMNISRPTVTRIYSSARKKIAEALTEGKAICFEGGPIINRCPKGGEGRGRHGKCCNKKVNNGEQQ
ncbi:MAG: DUF134 domain-containing protein [Phycisphaerae bacterium]|nr:DUF134 domain-containing protein [Phycisphaerae bacterium]